MTDKILEVRGLTKTYGGVKKRGAKKADPTLDVLKGIDLDIYRGDVVCLIGPSGCGKSTFLRCLNRLETPSSGSIKFEGVEVDEAHIDPVRQKMGMVFQHFNLFPHLTVKKNLELAPTLLKLKDKEAISARADELLARVGLADKANAYPKSLSGGQQQRIAIARALYQPGDVRLNTFLIDHAQDMSQMDEQTRQVVTARAKERLRQMTFYATGGGCLRAKILQYFGEKVEKPFCGNCSGCMAREGERDVSRQAGQIVAAVIAMNGRYGKATVARVLCGQADARLRERGLDKLSAFGSMKAEGEANVRAMIDELIAGDVLTVTEGDYPLLREGAYARDVLRGDMPIRMALLPTDAAPEIKRRVKQKEFVNKALYSRLSDLRKQIAMDQNVPPFIIFTNATLKDMAAKAPHTRAQMLRVAGVGEGKMQRYGDAFLREIAAYEEDEA